MAVYTKLSEKEVIECLKNYNIGTFISLKGIAQGIENSNFLLTTTQGTYILTLYEKRVKVEELPWYLDLMDHLAQKGISCPVPIKAKDGNTLHQLANRPAAIVSFLEGKEVTVVLPSHCFALGQAMANLHAAGADFLQKRANNVGPSAWQDLLNKSTGQGQDELVNEVRPILQEILTEWPSIDVDLPIGQIHADLFTDNVFFQGSELSGLIDFYFACTDFLVYDLAICLNAWCFTEEGEFLVEHAQSLLEGYQAIRPLTKVEKYYLPLLAKGAAVRFFLTRLYDWIYTPSDALVTPKDPKAYLYRLRFYQSTQALTYV